MESPHLAWTDYLQISCYRTNIKTVGHLSHGHLDSPYTQANIILKNTIFNTFFIFLNFKKCIKAINFPQRIALLPLVRDQLCYSRPEKPTI